MKAELIDHMGTDLSVVNAARVSFDKESTWRYECCGILEGFGCCEDYIKVRLDEGEKPAQPLTDSGMVSMKDYEIRTLKQSGYCRGCGQGIQRGDTPVAIISTRANGRNMNVTMCSTCIADINSQLNELGGPD